MRAGSKPIPRHPRYQMRRALRRATAILAIILGVAAVGLVQARPLFGLTPFPYDLSLEAVEKANATVRDISAIWAFHLDDGIPWEEVLEGKPLPKAVQREWDDWVRAVPPGRPVYLALAPLAKDRKSLAPAKGEKGNTGLPWSLKFADLDDAKVKAAYLEYARRAVKQFRPTYVNLGIEAGELAHRDPKRWPQFEALYLHVAQALKRDDPKLQIGLSFGLQSLRKPEVAQRAKALVQASDYLGLSFYPHMSPFGEKFGEPALPAGDAAWREPLEWARSFTNKPLAICETGFTTQNASLKSWDLNLRGDEQAQARYVRDLSALANRDNYLFVIWFLAIDYDLLYERMGNSKENEANLLWRNIGLYDGKLRPKPALAEWKKAVGGSVAALAPAPAAAPAAAKSVEPKPAEAAGGGTKIGFSQSAELFQAGPNSRTDLADGAMRWSYDYQGKDWIWAVRDVSAPAQATWMTLRVRSDQTGALFVQVVEDSGEAFFAIVEPREGWQDVRLELRKLPVDDAKKKDGVLQPGRIAKIILADAGARDGKKGQRTVWFANWGFE